MDRKTPSVSVPLAAEQVAGLASGHDVTSGPLGWSTITLDNASQVGELAEMFRASYAAVRKAKGKEQ
ncbi:hypothetical protein [Labilithrix luteola]|nr:hypothetical protein [Labilithrix luteola]